MAIEKINAERTNKDGMLVSINQLADKIDETIDHIASIEASLDALLTSHNMLAASIQAAGPSITKADIDTLRNRVTNVLERMDPRTTLLEKIALADGKLEYNENGALVEAKPKPAKTVRKVMKKAKKAKARK